MMHLKSKTIHIYPTTKLKSHHEINTHREATFIPTKKHFEGLQLRIRPFRIRVEDSYGNSPPTIRVQANIFSFFNQIMLGTIMNFHILVKITSTVSSHIEHIIK